MLDKNSYLTSEAQVELRKFKYDYLSSKLGVSKRRAEQLVKGQVRVLAIEKELIEDLLSDHVPA